MELLKELSLTHPWVAWCIASIAAVMLWQLAIVLAGLAFRRAAPDRLVPIWTIGIVGTLVLPAARLTVSPLQRPGVTWVTNEAGRDGTWFSAPAGVGEGKPSIEASLRTLPSDAISPLTFGLLLLVTGTLTILIRLIGSAARINRIVRRAIPWRHGDGLVEPGTHVVVSSEVNVPFAAGMLRRVIVLPEGMLRRPFSELKACLIHEATHVRRRDVLRHVLGRVATAVWWYSPFSWWIEKRLRLDSERVCDGEVVRSGVARQDYIRQIVQLAGGSILKRTVEPGWLPSLRTSPVMVRVESLCDPSTPTVEMSRRFNWVLTGCAVFLIVLLSRVTLPEPELGFVLLPEVSEAIVQP